MLNKLDNETWADLKKIVVFGYGRQTKKILKKLSKDFEIVAIVENDNDKCGYSREGISIVHFSQAEDLLKKYKVIVSVIELYYCEIREQLINLGLEEFVDFVKHEQFISEWYLRFRNQICIMKTDLFIASHCTLRCKHCSHFIPYWKKQINLSLEELKNTVDAYFKCVDFVFSMDILGGEAFLYKELRQIVEYISKNYRDRIAYLGIITNGTIIPDNDLLKCIKDNQVGISISDYAELIKNKTRVNEFCALLEEQQIMYIRNGDMTWLDLGFPEEPRKFSNDTVIEHRKKCKQNCHLISEGRFFYCAPIYASYKGELYALSSDDYMDLSECMQSREKLLHFALGEAKRKGCYTGFCNVCGGFGTDNNVEIIAGEQV